MLRFAEEIMLLLLNEDAGAPAFVPEEDLHHALAGAVLMDLALENRIDTDLERLVLVDPAPVGDDLLDPVLKSVAESEQAHEAEYWVRRIAEDGDRIRSAALTRLVEAGILQSAEEGAMLPSPKVARARRYPTAGAEQEVRLRIMGVLFGGDMPGPREVVVICLADACGIFERMLSKAERGEVQERIDQVRRMDLIGQAVTRAVRDSGREEAPASPPPTREIPFVKGAPLLGSAREAAKDVREFLTKQYLELGPVFEIRLLRRRILVLAGAEANQLVHRKGRLFLSSHDPMRGLAESLGASRLVLNMDGKEHVAMRKAMAPAFSGARFKAHLELASEVCRQHVAAQPEGKRIKPLFLMQRIVADQMGRILAGESASDYLEDLVVCLETVLVTSIAKQLPMFLFARRFKKARKRLEQLAHKSLQSHMPGGPHHDAGDLINDIIDLHRSDPQFMPETDMIAMALSPYLVGIETVANTCALTLYAILKHPDLKARIVAEADRFFAEPLSAESLRRLDVTHRAVLEAMRMYPAAPVIFRKVANSFDFAGYRIPAGKSLFVATSVTHRLPEFFPDPDRFDIDRHLPECAEHRQPNVFVPFGVGTHHCLGGNFAETQTLLAIATIFHVAELELDPPGYELKMTNVPTPRPAKSFRFRLKRLRQPAVQS